MDAPRAVVVHISRARTCCVGGKQQDQFTAAPRAAAAPSMGPPHEDFMRARKICTATARGAPKDHTRSL